MSYTVFARKYRPQTFDDVIGQEHITRTLKNAIEQNRLAHAYIFIGPRGTGKTSTARILAKALNCTQGPTVAPCGECTCCREIAGGSSMDVLEFDAASNTQVDKIRDIIIDNVKYAPTCGRYKLYIVDEVHMLSASSFNALLKTLEEPPAHVKFVFATTNVEKVPTTILSRCQRFDLKRIPTAQIAQHLLHIAAQEKIALSPEAAETVARGAEGGMRDAESMLDQLVAFCGESIGEEDVLKIFGFTARETVHNLCDHLIAGETPQALAIVHQQAEAGKDLSRLLGDLITHLRNLLVSKADPDSVQEELGAEAVSALATQGERIEVSKLLDLIEQFAGAEARMKWAPNKKMHFEIAVIRAVQTLAQASLSEVLESLAALRGGEAIPASTDKPSAQSAPAAARPPRVAARQLAAAPVRVQPVVATPPAIASAPAEEKPISAKSAEAPEVKVSNVETSPARVAKAAEASANAPLMREEAPTTSDSSTGKSVGEIWATVLSAVRRTRPLIAPWVESGMLAEIDDGTALLAFPPEQSLASEYCQQASNRKFLEGIFSETAGRPLSLRCVLREGLEVAPLAAAQSVASSEPETSSDPMEEFKNDPLIRKALEIFKAEIQPA